MITDEMWKLIREAQESAEYYRGHELNSFQSLNKNQDRMRANCVICNMEVDLILKPLPNEIDISGEAVALSCDD